MIFNAWKLHRNGMASNIFVSTKVESGHVNWNDKSIIYKSFC